MFGWASEQIEKLAQTVAPPPADAIGRFVYSVQREDETSAQGCLAEFADPGSTIVQPTKGNVALHLACLYGMERLIRQLMSVPNANIQVMDNNGNTPLHYACMSNAMATVALNTVRLLVTQFQASVVVKNSNGQTPYDVASINGVRQYLLPLQLQQETQHALDNGGVGLLPGIDLGGLRINKSHRAPPPIGGIPYQQPSVSSPYPQPSVSSPYPQPSLSSPYPQPSGSSMAPPPTATPSFQQPGAAPDFSTPSPNVAPQPYSAAACPPHVSSAPNSSNDAAHLYARSGHSSLAVGQSNKYRPDGFHSSSSDVNLQRKYGHVSTRVSGIAPPPSSANAIGPPPSSLGANPYARGSARSRYLAIDGSAVAPSSGGYGFMSPPVPAATPNVTTFMPTASAAYQQQPNQTQQAYPHSTQQAQNFPPPMNHPTYHSPVQPTETGHSQPQPTSVASSFFPPPPISIASQFSPYQAPNSTTSHAVSHPVTNSQPDPINNPPQAASSVFGSPSPKTITGASAVFETQPPIPSYQPMQHSVSSGTDSAQDLFAKPLASTFTKEVFSSNNTTNTDVVDNKIESTPGRNNAASECVGESEASGLEDSMDGMQDISLSQEDRVEVVSPTAQDLFSSVGGLPPPPFFNKK